MICSIEHSIEIFTANSSPKVSEDNTINIDHRYNFELDSISQIMSFWAE